MLKLWHTRRRVLLAACVLLYLWTALGSLVFRVTSVQLENYDGQIGPDVEAQLAFIRTVLHEHETLAQEQPLPDWVVFVHTFYGFSLVNTVLLDPDSQPRRADAVAELEWVLERLNIPEAKGSYPHTQVPHGVLYLGERNLTLAGLALIDPALDAEREQEFHHTSRLLYKAFMDSPSANLDTYPGHCWPTDNVPALYSLLVHDRLYGTNYSQAAARWVEMMQALLDPDTGLMPAKIDYHTARVLNVPRGCALSFTFIFLPDLDPRFAETQYAAYRQHYLKSTLGFAGLREYPPGIGRRADVDSGPIIREVGAAATGIGIGAAKAMGDAGTFESIVQLSEIIGLPVQRGGQKSYLLGRLPIGDIIQVWGKTITPWSPSPAKDQASENPWPAIGSISLTPFYGIACLVGGLLLLFSVALIRRIRRQPGWTRLLSERAPHPAPASVLFWGQAAIWAIVWLVPVFGIVGVLVLSGLLEVVAHLSKKFTWSADLADKAD